MVGLDGLKGFFQPKGFHVLWREGSQTHEVKRWQRAGLQHLTELPAGQDWCDAPTTTSQKDLPPLHCWRSCLFYRLRFAGWMNASVASRRVGIHELVDTNVTHVQTMTLVVEQLFSFQCPLHCSAQKLFCNDLHSPVTYSPGHSHLCVDKNQT